MNANQGKDMKGTRPDQNVADPSKDLTASAGQQQGSQQSGRQQGSQQSGQQQRSQQQGNLQSGQQQGGQQSGQQQGSQQSGLQGDRQGGQHASGGTPALDDPDQRQGESARDASQAFNQQQDKGDRNR
ncbi:hypothetical protein LQ564_24915 [Massilia sp. G4R7]|uniref:Uncharacterized protein n=1 Tax=Massilia phyllostachyos TaxID=2898585 RepID=A0ABS8QCR9_9BURK|nr:hypothetical protein [Massilia phyllostachyos]MCD2519551.1 hypothetical protein [Massilia phyllostachyos]